MFHCFAGHSKLVFDMFNMIVAHYLGFNPFHEYFLDRALQSAGRSRYGMFLLLSALPTEERASQIAVRQEPDNSSAKKAGEKVFVKSNADLKNGRRGSKRCAERCTT